MIKLDRNLKPADFGPALERFFELAGGKIRRLDARYESAQGAPVFTIAGRYGARGWTEWTQGFQYGLALLQFEATGDSEFLELGRGRTLERMAPHVSHRGVHDHGFNNVSTYGNLLRLMAEGMIPENEWERSCYELALKCSGAVQAMRWTALPGEEGYVYSFNGPHSLFSDTIRSMRSLVLAHRLGHVLMDEQDAKVNLLERSIRHAAATSKYNVYLGEGRDHYDIPGRVVHESIFNPASGSYRCPSTQQGYSPFSTWTRGLAWLLCGYPEQLEFFESLENGDERSVPTERRQEAAALHLRTARAVADFYIEQSPVDGIPYWDTGAPGLAAMGAYLFRPAEPYNDHEPVDSSAAAIAAQGLLRLGNYLQQRGQEAEGERYWQAGLATAQTLFGDDYVATDPAHEGLILHSIYHRPNGWDHVPEGRQIPCGESSLWGDYHAMELAVMLKRLADGKPHQRFFTI
ncbi:MAG: glycosyl hydrolase [Verrucomicrobiota bacterium]